jgi:glycerol-3-phosphate acyltransferase PlsY
MMTAKEMAVILACYGLGCFTAGYYWVRWRTGLDIRRQGSGNVGARNVGRFLGSAGFAITFVLDLAKGALDSSPWPTVRSSSATFRTTPTSPIGSSPGRST